MDLWKLIFYETEQGGSPVRDFLRALPPDERRILGQALFVLQQRGLELGRPQVAPLGGGLYELRERIGRSRHRVLYVALTGHQFLLLHGFTKKESAVPQSDLDLARTRLADWRRRHP